IQTVPPGNGLSFHIYSLGGGKWTTLRAFAAQGADRVLADLNRMQEVSRAPLAFGAGREDPKIEPDKREWLLNLRSQTEVELERLEELFDRYGTYAAEVAAFIAGGDDQPVAHTPGYSRREVLFIAQREWVAHLDDVLLRRS